MLGIDLNETTDVFLPAPVEARPAVAAQAATETTLEVKEQPAVEASAGVRWTVGLLPLGKFDAILDAIDKAWRPFRAHSQTHEKGDNLDACLTCSDLLGQAGVEMRPFRREAVRWGVRGTSAPVVLETETVKFQGKDYTVLTEASIERLIRVRLFGRDLISALATKVVEANQLDERTILGF